MRALHAIVNRRGPDLAQTLQERLGIDYAEDLGIRQASKRSERDRWQQRTAISLALGPQRFSHAPLPRGWRGAGGEVF